MSNKEPGYVYILTNPSFREDRVKIGKRITVNMSTRRWNRMLQLEETYKLARIIRRSMKQVETEPSMTPDEAVAALRAL